jgi:hypothetical protein
MIGHMCIYSYVSFQRVGRYLNLGNLGLGLGKVANNLRLRSKHAIRAHGRCNNFFLVYRFK